MLDIGKLLLTPIDWQKTGESKYVFAAQVDGIELRLRLNDFPDEPLCTLIWDAGEQDLEDLGRRWTLPAHREEAD